MSGEVAARAAAVRERIARAAERAGRDPAEIVVVAATKTFDERAVAAWRDAGGSDVGESYVQEAARKREAVAALGVVGLRWHLIGRLQRNKARRAVELFDVVHSLDDLRLAVALDRAAAERGSRLDCLVEVNVGDEASKGGVALDAAADFVRSASAFGHLRVVGLTAIPPESDDPEDSRPHFRALRELRERLPELPPAHGQPKELSMGMSGDFEVAVEEGATIVRIGRALFGERS